MLEQLEKAKKFIKDNDLLNKENFWNSIHIDYETPTVDRLWCQMDKSRIYLHAIYPSEKSYYHPHSWPSCMEILKGRYKMEMGIKDKILSTIILSSGSQYEMIEPTGFHSVCPLDETVYTLMITSTPYSNPVEQPVKAPPQRELDIKQKLFLLDVFKKILK